MKSPCRRHLLSCLGARMQGTFVVTGTLRAELSEWLTEFELGAHAQNR
jgi:hypothetical protein